MLIYGLSPMPSKGLDNKAVGQSALRREGLQKVRGESLYIDDMPLQGFLHGATVRSHLPRGRIANISFGEGIPWHEFTIASAKDIPGQNVIALIDTDQPCLADQVVNHTEEPIVLLAHPDPYLLEKARAFVHIEIDPLPAVLSIQDSLQQKAIVWGKDNVFKRVHIDKGDVDRALAGAAHVVEETYHTGAQEQLYIEPNGVIADFSKGNVTIWGSMQCPYYIHKALKPIFNLSDDQVRVIQVETGGGFGGKEDYPSLIASHAALLSFKSGKPVKMIYDRGEDMSATTKRHPSESRYKMGFDSEGNLIAADIEFIVDGGAYLTLSPVVVSRGSLHALGPYRCPNVRMRNLAVATNTPPHGAFRGFGAPQSVFALERHFDKAARVLGISPLDLRRCNLLKHGETMATGQVVRDHVDMQVLLKEGLAATDFEAKQKQFAVSNALGPVKKGIGLATFIHGAGFTGSGEKRLASIVEAEAGADGKVRILSASTEIGQGTNTVFAQLAADAVGLPYDSIVVAQPDTQVVPDSGPTVASRTVMVVGKLVEQAASQLKATLIEQGFLREPYTEAEWIDACARHTKDRGPLRSMAQYEQPAEIVWDEENYRGDGYPCYAKAVYVAEVSVDTRTYEIHVDHFTALQDVGKVVHPILAAGQIEGGVAQGIGYALYEKVRWQGGTMQNNRMTNYIVPTAADMPSVQVIFRETPSPYGPQGAVGIGELPLDGAAPAVLAAIEDAIGLFFRHIPVMPEDVFVAEEARHALHD